jgi:DASH complex subunit DAD3
MDQIFSVNAYEDHPGLTQIEADVLWEYAKLNQHIKDVRYTPPRLPVVLDRDPRRVLYVYGSNKLNAS